MQSFRSGPFVPALDRPFAKTARDLYDAVHTVEGSGDTAGPVAFLWDDDRGSDVFERMRRPLESAGAGVSATGGFVFVSSDGGFLDACWESVAPDALECCVLIQLPTDVAATDPISVRAAVGAAAWSEMDTTAAPSGGEDSALEADAPRFTWTDLDPATELLGAFAAASDFLHQGAAWVESLLAVDTEAIVDGFLDELERRLVAAARRLVESEAEGVLDFADEASEFLEDLRGSFDWFFASLPDTPAGESYVLELVQDRLADSPVFQLARAKQEFEAAFYGTLLSSESLEQVLTENLESLTENQKQIADLALGGAFVGSAAFAVGTVFQIGYDIVNTFVQIIKYGAKGAVYLYTQAVVRPEALDEDTLAPASDSLVDELFDLFDSETFLSEDLPAIVADVRAFVEALIEDFVDNAAAYGESAAEYVAGALGDASSVSLGVLFDPYDPQASLPDRMLYVVDQWFSLGRALGPLIVDVALLFCSGGTTGVVSAAAKMGRIESLGSALKFTRRGVDSLTSLAHYNRIIEKIPPRLQATIARLFDDLWASVGSPVDRIVDYAQAAQDATPDGVDWPDLDEFAAAVDTWYDRCSALNLFIGIFVLLSGRGEIASDGSLGLADEL